MQQMTKHRPLAELDLLDDFLFNALLAYPEYGRRFCRKFLKILFGREFKNLNIVTQKSYGGKESCGYREESGRCRKTPGGRRETES